MAPNLEADIFRVFTAPLGCELLNRGTRIVEKKGWYQIITPGSKHPTRNMVLFSQVADSEAEIVIDETIAQYRAIEAPFRWCVGPPTRPFDFGERLARRGFAVADIRGMGSAPEQIVAADVPDVVVERTTRERSYLYAETMVKGWHTGDGLPSNDEIANAQEDEAWANSQPGERFQSFIAYYQGEPAGTAGFIIKGDLAYLVGGNVISAYRKRGVYRALVGARMTRLRELGIRYAATQAREATSAPILEKLGFASLYQSKIFSLP